MNASRPALPPLPVTVDTVIFTVRGGTLQVLLVRRAEAKFEGLWSLPGGFVEPSEPLESAALRELQDATGVTDVYLEQLYTFGNRNRDPIEIMGGPRVVSVAYMALTHEDKVDTENAEWRDWYERHGKKGIRKAPEKIKDWALSLLERFRGRDKQPEAWRGWTLFRRIAATVGLLFFGLLLLAGYMVWRIV